MSRLPLRKRVAYSLVLLAFLWVLVELTCLGALWYLGKYKGLEYKPGVVRTLSNKHRGILESYLGGRASYVMFDPDLGWTVRPNGKKPLYRANSQGLRGTREYALQPAPGVVRIATFGDSFTHCDGVRTGGSWQEQLEAQAPGFEMLNFGVPGFEPGQAFLRYRKEGQRFHPHIVLIGSMSENIKRAVNTYRPFYFPRSGIPLAKPRFALRRGELVLVENPIRSLEGYRELLRDPESVLPRMGEDDFFYQTNSRRSRLDVLPSVRFIRVVADEYFHEPIYENGVYNTRSEAYEVLVAVLDAFYRQVLDDGSLPVIVLFPERRDVVRVQRDGRPVTYQPLVKHLRRAGYRVIDVMEGFERYDPEGEIARLRYAHYPKVGNGMVARHLLDYLESNGLTRPEAVREAVAAERKKALTP
jgi:hypothetical protein